MGNGSFQKYQHYLPATYIRSFSPPEIGGNDTVLGFVKKDASKEQIIKRCIPLNVKKICGDDFRHTIYFEGQRDNIIEDLFGILERIYPDIKSILDYYSYKKDIYQKLFPKGYCILQFTPIKKIIKAEKHYRLLSGFCEIDSGEIKNLTIFLSQFIYRRLKKLDSEISQTPLPKMKELPNLIKITVNSNKDLLPEHYEIIKKNDWRDLLKVINDASNHLPLSDKKVMRDLKNIYYKFYRYLSFPFLSSDQIYKGVNIFVFRPPVEHLLISSDSPFFQLQKKSSEIDFTEDCIFTLTPHMALLFTTKKRPHVKSTQRFSDRICKENVSNAEKYIFSNNLKRLNFFTQHLTPTGKAPKKNNRV